MQHSDDRLTMDLLNTSKMIWSTTTSPTLSPAFKNSFKLSTHDTGNKKEKFPENPIFPSHPETSPNPSLMHPSQTTSLARILQSQRTTLALHNTSAPKETTSDLPHQEMGKVEGCPQPNEDITSSLTSSLS